MTNGNYRLKARAVFLAALMVFSVFAGTVAFAGTAAANASDISEVSAEDVPVEQDEVTQKIELDITVTDGNDDTVNIDTADVPAGVSVDNIDVISTNTSAVSVSSISSSSFDVADESPSGEDGTATVLVYFEHNTEGLSPQTGANIDFNASSGDGSAEVAFDLVAGNDAQLNSGSTYWQGQETAVYVDGSFSSGGVTIEGDDQLQIREYDTSGDDPQIGTLQDEFSLEGGYADVSTDDLDGEYVVTPASDSSVALVIDDGEITSVVEESNLAANTVAWEVTTQDLSIDFDEESVTNSGEDSANELEIETNRGSSDIEVSADGDLEQQELLDIFSDSAFNAQPLPDYDDDSEDTIVLGSIGDVTEDTDFEDIDEGEYEFTFEVSDSTAEDSGTVEVTESDVDAGFSQGTFSQTAGDVVNMTIQLEDTDSAWVQLGDEDSGFVDILYIEDDDDDDEVTFWVNTRTVGTSAAFDQTYYSEDDIVESQIHGGIDEPDSGPTFEDEDGNDIGTFSDYLTELDLIDSDEDPTDQLIRPLQPTTYDVSVGGDEVFIVNDDDESELNDEIGLATLDLTEPGVDNLQTWTAPSDNADADEELQEVLDIVTQQTEIAEDDRLVIQAEASGIYGHMVAIDENGFDAFEDGFSASTLYELDERDGEGVDFTVEADDATGNQEATSLDLENVDNQDIFILVDNQAGQMFIIVDTSSDDAFSGGDIDTPEEFTADLTYETDSSDRFEFDGSGPLGGADGDTDEAAYPYFDTGDDQSQSAEFTIAEGSATFDNQQDGVVQIANTGEATVSGETNIAPGSDASVRVRSDQGVSPSFVKTVSTEIGDDGVFEATFDFSEQSVGDTGTVSLRVGGSAYGQTDAEIVEDVGTATPEPDTATPEPDTATPEPDTATPEPDTATPEPEPDTDTPTETDTGTPGFGVVVALTALIAAALLAIRRES
ncbi:BGTF surface domain-containing protein [Halobellus litoreus]|uniref:BGTF surface domain-containing protein n=1 Tax=Halobellus litoreus TaxID=755310 RepID=A0ABD6DQ79_9EURY|nr:BGTF surface domain-containing protein [Halobellus litoreus]